MTAGRVWVGDGLVDGGGAALAADDHGVTTGDGCFETMKVVDGTAFALTRHLARLQRSCAGLGLAAVDDDVVRRAVGETIAANGPGVGRVRVTVTAGRAPLGSGRGTDAPTLTVLTGPAPDWEPTASAAVCPWVRNERSAVAGLKTTSYAENVVALAWANEQGVGEALFANTRGELCEGTGTNVFLVVDGRLLTPALDSGCLAGITREVLCEIVDVDQRAVSLAQLAAASEAFLTSSTRDLHPLHELDGRALPAPGRVTAAAQEAWAALQARTLDP
jgi:branched-chain amino acid aminotransferase